MDLLPTLPRRTWLERVSITLAIGLIAVSAFSVAGWWLHQEAWLEPFAGRAAMKFNAAVGFLLLGLIALALEFGGRRLAWLALLPAALGTATLVEILFRLDLQIDEA